MEREGARWGSDNASRSDNVDIEEFIWMLLLDSHVIGHASLTTCITSTHAHTYCLTHMVCQPWSDSKFMVMGPGRTTRGLCTYVIIGRTCV